MPERISLLESYDNKDVITQIYRLVQTVDSGTYRDLAVTRDGNNINFVFTTNDDQVHTYAVPDAGITDVSGSATGSQVTITFTMTDGTTRSFTYTATGGVTIDTDQTISGMKVFSAASTNFSHDVDVGADLNVGGTVEANELTVDTDATVDGTLHVGGDLAVTGKIADDVTVASGHSIELENAGAIEPSNSDMVISPGSRLLVKCSNGQDLEMVVASTGVIVDKVTASTSANVPDTQIKTRSTAAVNGNRLQNDLDAYEPMIRNVGTQTVGGIKDFIDRCAFRKAPKQTVSSFTARFSSADRFTEFCKIPAQAGSTFVFMGICCERTDHNMCVFKVSIALDSDGGISSMTSVYRNILQDTSTRYDVDMGARVEDGYIVLSIGLNRQTNNSVTVTLMNCFHASGTQDDPVWIPSSPGAAFTHRCVIG